MTPLSAMFQSVLVVKIDRYLFAHHHERVIYLKHHLIILSESQRVQQLSSVHPEELWKQQSELLII